MAEERVAVESVASIEAPGTSSDNIEGLRVMAEEGKGGNGGEAGSGGRGGDGRR